MTTTNNDISYEDVHKFLVINKLNKTLEKFEKEAKDLVKSSSKECKSKVSNDKENDKKPKIEEEPKKINSAEANEKKIASINSAFKRVREEDVTYSDDRLKSNDFMSKSGAQGSYGEKAYKDLAPTKGKGFRTEKNKKKKGSYRGGQIDTDTVHSIKFDSD